MFPSRIEILEERIEKVEEKLDRIISILETQQPIQQRLDSHISFVESVYSRIRGSISWLSRQKTLPEPSGTPRITQDSSTEESSV